MRLANTYIGFDWDGTLELFELQPSVELIQLLKDLQDQGAQLFLASGKSCFALEAASEDIIEPFMFAGESGGHIRIPSQGIDQFAEVSDDLKHFDEIIKNYTLPPHSPHPVPKETLWCRMFGEYALEAAQVLNRAIKEHHLALDVFPHPEIDGAVDVAPHSLTKANVLKFIPKDAKIYYFGDGLNDLALLKHERVFPCTMSNAHDQVKEIVKARGGKIAGGRACVGVYEILSELFKA